MGDLVQMKTLVQENVGQSYDDYTTISTKIEARVRASSMARTYQ